MESKLIELKAKIKSLNFIRSKLKELNASHVGTYQQHDTYYNIPNGRLKLREIKGKKEAKLIYYDRENISEPKKSKIIVLEIQEPESFKLLGKRALTERIVIDKKREIYIYKETQIHLDCVKDLGTFIEFERIMTDYIKDRKSLDNLKKILKIQDTDLIKGSYSDLLFHKVKKFKN